MMLWEYIPISTRYHLFLLLVSPTRQSQQNQGLSGRLGHHSPSFTLSTYIKKRDEYVSSDELEEISCKFKIKNQIYVDHTNRVWPCCYLPNKKNLLGSQKFYDDYYYDKSNNLIEKTLSEILHDNFYELLQLSWTEKFACLEKCKSTCTATRSIGNTIKSSDFRQDIW